LAKRRFGISINSDIAMALDEIAKNFGLDRSRLVEEAIRSYIEEYKHFTKKHICRGIFIVRNKGGEPKIDEVFEDYRDIIVSHSHHHIAGECILTVIVYGDSERVTELHKKLLCSCTTRYIPLPHD